MARLSSTELAGCVLRRFIYLQTATHPALTELNVEQLVE